MKKVWSAALAALLGTLALASSAQAYSWTTVDEAKDRDSSRTYAAVYGKFELSPARVLVNASEGRTKVKLSIHCFSGDADTMVRKREVTKHYTSRGIIQTWRKPLTFKPGPDWVYGPGPDDFEPGFCFVEAEASAEKGRLRVRLQMPTEG